MKYNKLQRLGWRAVHSSEWKWEDSFESKI